MQMNNKCLDVFAKKHVTATLALLLLAIIFFAPFFFQGKVFLAGDNLWIHYPWKDFAPNGFHPHNVLITDPVNYSIAEVYNNRLNEGALSLWNPTVLTGIPAFISAGIYYPIKMLLHAALPTYSATTLFLFAHILLMGLFMYAYLTEIGVSVRGSLFGAVAYMFNGCVMVWLEYELWVAIGALFPALLFCMEKFLTAKRLPYAFGGGIIYGFMLLSGSFQLSLYVSVFAMMYGTFLLIRSTKAQEGARGIQAIIACLFLTAVTGVLIGAVEILPFIEMLSLSSRIARTFSFQQFFDTLARVPYRWFVTLVFPDYFGSPPLNLDLIPALHSQEYMNFNELTIYMGISTVFAFIACLVMRKNRFAAYYIFMTFLILALIVGSYVYYPFFLFVPGMDKMNPTRLIFLFAFVFSAAAGLGIDGLEHATAMRKRLYIFVSLIITVIIVLLSLLSARPDIIQWFNAELFAGLTTSRYVIQLVSIQGIRMATSPVIFKPLVLTLVSFFLFSAYALFKRRKIGQLIFFLIFIVLGYDLISYGRNYNTAVSPEIIYTKTPAIDFLLKQPGPFRVLQDVDMGFWVNSLSPFGLEEVGGYRSVYPDRVNKLMSYIRFGDKAFEGDLFDRCVTFGSRSTELSSPLLSLMNVRYVLTAPFRVLSHHDYRLVFNKEIFVYENRHAMPRAYVVHRSTVKHSLTQVLRFMGSSDFDLRHQVVLEEDPSPEIIKGLGSPRYQPTAVIDVYTPDKVQISTDLSTNGWLVLSDTYYPGWQAEVDGKDTRIVRANGNFRAVELSAGKHRIIFRYAPLSYRAGMAVTIIGAMLAGAGVIVFRKTAFAVNPAP